LIEQRLANLQTDIFNFYTLAVVSKAQKKDHVRFIAIWLSVRSRTRHHRHQFTRRSHHHLLHHNNHVHPRRSITTTYSDPSLMAFELFRHSRLDPKPHFRLWLVFQKPPSIWTPFSPPCFRIWRFSPHCLENSAQRA